MRPAINEEKNIGAKSQKNYYHNEPRPGDRQINPSNFFEPRFFHLFNAINVRDIRSFSGTKWKKNLGEARAEG